MCYAILTRFSFPCLGCQKLIDAKLYELLGERTAADNEKPSKQKKEKPAKVEVSEFHACYIYPCICLIKEFWLLSIFGPVYTVIVQDKKVADENPVQPSEDLNPFLIFPNPEENFKVFDYGNSWLSDFDVKHYCVSFFNLSRCAFYTLSGVIDSILPFFVNEV